MRRARSSLAPLLAALALGAAACGGDDVERSVEDGAKQVEEAGRDAEKAGKDAAGKAEKGVEDAQDELEK